MDNNRAGKFQSLEKVTFAQWKVGYILYMMVLMIFIMFFHDSLSAQNTVKEDTSVIYIKENWKGSKEKEIEHYKNYVPEIIPECFVLGTLHFFNVRNDNQVDLYANYEKPLVDFLVGYVQEKFGFTLQKEKEEGGFATYSSELLKRLKNYFDKEGNLDISLFKSDEEICSFLLGVYYRDGDKIDDSIYKINFASPYHELVYLLLKRIECDRIFYVHEKYLVPGGYRYYFEPSVLLKKYFDSIEMERIKLYNYFIENSKYYRKDEDKQYRKKEKEMIEAFFPFL